MDDKEELNKLLEMAYFTIDEDGSGEIDRKELRVGLCQVFANQSAKIIHKLEKKLKDSGVIPGQELLSLEDFMDTVECVRNELRAYNANQKSPNLGSVVKGDTELRGSARKFKLFSGSRSSRGSAVLPSEVENTSTTEQ